MAEKYTKFEVRPARPDRLVLSLRGGLSWDEREALTSEVESCLDQHTEARDIVLDLRDVGFVNSAGLGALFGLVSKLRQRDGQVAFANVSPLLHRVFHAVGLDRVTRVASTVDEALAKLDRPVGTSACAAQN